MSTLTRTAVSARTVLSLYVAGLLERARRDDAGQASTEYAGIIFVIVALIAVIVGLAAGFGADIGAKITEAIQSLGA